MKPAELQEQPARKEGEGKAGWSDRRSSPPVQSSDDDEGR
jgi:hypothetical protein